MAYLGSTQASSIANPPTMLVGQVGAGPDAHIDASTAFKLNNYQQSSTNASRDKGLGSGQQVWFYTTTDMTSAYVDSSTNWSFSDGGALGMKPGDIVFWVAHGTSVGTSWYLRMSVIGYVTTAGAAYLSTQASITCTT